MGSNSCCPYFSDGVKNGFITSSSAETLLISQKGPDGSVRARSVFFCPWCGEKKAEPRFFGSDAPYPATLQAPLQVLAEQRGNHEEQIAGSVFRHYKGNIYHGLAVADYTGERKLHRDGLASGFPEGEKLVVYIGCYDNPHGNRVCTRPLSEWGEPVEATLEQRKLLGDDIHKPYRPRYTKIA